MYRAGIYDHMSTHFDFILSSFPYLLIKIMKMLLIRYDDWTWAISVWHTQSNQHRNNNNNNCILRNWDNKFQTIPQVALHNVCEWVLCSHLDAPHKVNQSSSFVGAQRSFIWIYVVIALHLNIHRNCIYFRSVNVFARVCVHHEWHVWRIST